MFEQVPQAPADRIEDIDRIKIPYSPANGHDNRLPRDFAGNDGRVPDVADLCRMYRRGQVSRPRKL